MFRTACIIGGAATLAAVVLAPGYASAGSLETLHKFCKQTGCPDGEEPWASLLMADNRHFFGMAEFGGPHATSLYNGGVVYELIRNNDGSWTYKNVYSFCAQADCADGDRPESDLIVDKDGDLYGTTWHGGQYGQGTVFQLRKSGASWIETVIHSFHCVQPSCSDGQEPSAGLTYAGQATGTPWDEFSPLYGTTRTGGSYGKGTVFRLTNDGPSWNETVIHAFATSRDPAGGMIMDGSGNLYGATRGEGANGGGVFYRLNHDSWSETILHQFCSETDCADGQTMGSRPVTDASGNLYGATWYGGAHSGGVAFELMRKKGFGYTYKVLSDFCNASTCTGGNIVGIVMDNAGDLYGATIGGGSNSRGTLFRLHNTTGGWKRSVLYSFCVLSECRDGASPVAAPILDAQGKLLGTTHGGGNATSFGGTVFEFTP